MLYFAYGSNMNHEQIKQRCPSSKFIKRASKKGYKFVYDGYSMKWKAAVANIVESTGSVVWGGLFEINDDNLAALDCYENYPKSYDKKTIIVRDDEGKNHGAIAYFRVGQKVGVPHEKYREIVIQGASDCGLPEDYIKNNLWSVQEKNY